MADLVASWSKDPSRKVGAVVVRPDKTVAAVGYNGFARGVEDSYELLNDRDSKYARTIHAETNAVLNSRTGVDGCTLYVSLVPCSGCAGVVIQSGIRRVVARLPMDEDLMARWGDSFKTTRQLFKEAGLEYVERLTVAS